MSWFVYILLCDERNYYVGLTSNLKNRISSDKNKGNISTKEFKDVNLVYKENYLTRRLAEKREKQIKGWTIAKKKALVSGRKDLLVKLSKTHGLVRRSHGGK